nr:hypothetical protein [Polymorphobacter sp.]
MRKRFSSLLFGVAALALLVSPAVAGVEDEVHRLVQAGEIMPFETIRSRVVSQTRGDYMGADIDLATRVYRFRFLVNGNVINVDVDARTGQRARRTNSY